MTAITREYLDALAARHDGTPREAALIAILSRILDLRDRHVDRMLRWTWITDLDAALAGTQTDAPTYIGGRNGGAGAPRLAGTQTEPLAEEPTHVPCCSAHGESMTCEKYRRTHFVEVRPCCSVDAERLAGTQTDDGAGGSTPAVSSGGETPPGEQSPAPAPSSPDRIEAVARALGVIGPAASDRYRMAQAELAVAALDAYDREHPPAALRDALADLRYATEQGDLYLAQKKRALVEMEDWRLAAKNAEAERDALAAENARLRAEVEVRTHTAKRAQELSARCMRDERTARSEVERQRAAWRSLSDLRWQLAEERDRAEHERDEACARGAAVLALCDGVMPSSPYTLAAEIRAALAATEDTEAARAIRAGVAEAEATWRTLPAQQPAPLRTTEAEVCACRHPVAAHRAGQWGACDYECGCQRITPEAGAES